MFSTDPGFNRAPKYKAYEVVDVHTNEVVGVYPTRREANDHKTLPSHRIRGSYAKLPKSKKAKPRPVPKAPKPKDRDRSLIGKARVRARKQSRPL